VTPALTLPASLTAARTFRAARASVKDLVLSLRRIELAVAGGRSEEAVAEYASFARLATFDVPQALKRAEPWTLFNPSVHDAYYRALGAMLQSADKSLH